MSFEFEQSYEQVLDNRVVLFVNDEAFFKEKVKLAAVNASRRVQHLACLVAIIAREDVDVGGLELEPDLL